MFTQQDLYDRAGSLSKCYVICITLVMKPLASFPVQAAAGVLSLLDLEWNPGVAAQLALCVEGAVANIPGNGNLLLLNVNAAPTPPLNAPSAQLVAAIQLDGLCCKSMQLLKKNKSYLLCALCWREMVSLIVQYIIFLTSKLIE